MDIVQEMQMDLEFLRVLTKDMEEEHTTTFLAMMGYLCKLFLTSPTHSKVILGHMKSELYVYSEMLFQNKSNDEFIATNTATFFDHLHLLSKIV